MFVLINSSEKKVNNNSIIVYVLLMNVYFAKITKEA